MDYCIHIVYSGETEEGRGPRTDRLYTGRQIICPVYAVFNREDNEQNCLCYEHHQSEVKTQPSATSPHLHCYYSV